MWVSLRIDWLMNQPRNSIQRLAGSKLLPVRGGCGSLHETGTKFGPRLMEVLVLARQLPRFNQIAIRLPVGVLFGVGLFQSLSQQLLCLRGFFGIVLAELVGLHRNQIGQAAKKEAPRRRHPLVDVDRRRGGEG